MLHFDNHTFFDGERLIENQDVSFDVGGLKSIKSQSDGSSNGYITPGFIDLQIYGAGGKLFSAEPTAESISIIEDSLLKVGTAGFLICLATNTPQVFNDCIAVVKNHRTSAKNCLGLHLEGPFINPKRRGAHVLEYIRKADLDEIKKLIDYGDGTIKMMTLAPELQDDSVIQFLLDNNIIVSLGHSDATFKQATDAYDKGIQTTTHLFNAMTPLQHREPGIPSAVFNHGSAMASIIADGMHVDFEVVKLAKKLMRERLFLITDAVTDCNIGPYQHQAVDGKFVMPDGTLSGSAITMIDAIRNCVSHCDINLEEAFRMASLYPRQLYNTSNSDKLNAFANSDFLVLDTKLNLKQVFYKGAEI